MKDSIPFTEACETNMKSEPPQQLPLPPSRPPILKQTWNKILGRKSYSLVRDLSEFDHGDVKRRPKGASIWTEFSGWIAFLLSILLFIFEDRLPFQFHKPFRDPENKVCDPWECERCIRFFESDKVRCSQFGINCDCYVDNSTEYDVVHVIAPFQADEDNPSWQYYAQPIAMASIVRAKTFARIHGVHVQLILFGREVDIEYGSLFVPEATQVLQTRCLSDLAPHLDLPCLPLIKDFFDAAYDNSRADIVIYTNADIGVYENFYIDAVEKMKQYPAMSVERKNIAQHSERGKRFSKDDLDEIYNLPKITEEHPGGDCFVWRKEIFAKDDIDMAESIVGSIYWDGLFKLMLMQKDGEDLNYHRDTSRNMTWHQGTEYGWQATKPGACMRNCWNLLTGSRVINLRTELNNGDDGVQHQFKRMRKAVCRFGRHFQCSKFPGMLDYFYPDWQQRARVEESCQFFDEQTECTAPHKWRRMTHIVGKLECANGQCLTPDDNGFKSYQYAFKKCTTTPFCHIVQKSPDELFRLRRTAVGFQFSKRIDYNGYAFTYVKCEPEYREVLPPREQSRRSDVGLWPIDMYDDSIVSESENRVHSKSNVGNQTS